MRSARHCHKCKESTYSDPRFLAAANSKAEVIFCSAQYDSAMGCQGSWGRRGRDGRGNSCGSLFRIKTRLSCQTNFDRVAALRCMSMRVLGSGPPQKDTGYGGEAVAPLSTPERASQPRGIVGYLKFRISSYTQARNVGAGERSGQSPSHGWLPDPGPSILRWYM